MTNEEIRTFLYVSIISADNDEFTEEEKQAVMARHKAQDNYKDWRYILEPLNDTEKRNKLIQLLEATYK